MLVDHVTVGMFMENAFVVACPESREGVIIDPGDESDRIAELIDRHRVKPLRIVNTHAHIDHVGAVAELKRDYGIPFALNRGEEQNLSNLASHAAVFGLSAPEQPEVDEWLVDGDVVRFGGASLTVLETPGHTPGGISFVGEGFVIAGDTLFAGSIGRTDLPGGDFATLRKSIRDGLFELPPDTVVHCGHGPSTTIGREKTTNPFVGDGADPAMFGL